MSVFLDDYMNFILQKIYLNQNLCKYIAYDCDDPIAFVDIADTTTLFTDKLDQRVYTIPFNIDILSSQKTSLTINVSNATMKDRIWFKEVKLNFFILCPYSLWQLSSAGGISVIRPNGIVTELMNTFNHEKTVGLGKNYFESLRTIFPNQYVGGYSLILNCTDFVNG